MGFHVLKITISMSSNFAPQFQTKTSPYCHTVFECLWGMRLGGHFVSCSCHVSVAKPSGRIFLTTDENMREMEDWKTLKPVGTNGLNLKSRWFPVGFFNYCLIVPMRRSPSQPQPQHVVVQACKSASPNKGSAQWLSPQVSVDGVNWVLFLDRAVFKTPVGWW